jgi:hypothetical protein
MIILLLLKGFRQTFFVVTTGSQIYTGGGFLKAEKEEDIIFAKIYRFFLILFALKYIK